MMPKLKEELRTIFNDYGLKYVFDTNSQEIKVMKEKKPGEIFLIPFHSIADTLQRMIFYKAAIESNSESALVFEEPEAHSYPPFISKVTQDIIQSDRNQFFITTHSPYVVNDFLELPSDQLAIYLVDFRKCTNMASTYFSTLKHSERYRTHCRHKPIPKSTAYAYSTVLTG